MKERLSPASRTGGNIALPEQQLFAAVILQAFQDATGKPSNWWTSEDRRARREARNWLTSPSQWLRDVCDYAGLDYQSVFDKATALAKHNWSRRGFDIPRAA